MAHSIKTFHPLKISYLDTCIFLEVYIKSKQCFEPTKKRVLFLFHAVRNVWCDTNLKRMNLSIYNEYLLSPSPHWQFYVL